MGWQPHTDNICKQVTRNLFLLGQIRKYADVGCRKLFFNTHLLAHINYASTVWCNASEVHLKIKQKTLNSLHKRAVQLILPDHSLSTTAKVKKLDILALQEQLVYNTAVLMFKVHTGWGSQYLCNLLNRELARYE